jgi:hypothetical protein
LHPLLGGTVSQSISCCSLHQMHKLSTPMLFRFEVRQHLRLTSLPLFKKLSPSMLPAQCRAIADSLTR